MIENMGYVKDVYNKYLWKRCKLLPSLELGDM